jgi:integrase
VSPHFTRAASVSRRRPRHGRDSTPLTRRTARHGTGTIAPELEAELDAYVEWCYANGHAATTLRVKRVFLRQVIVEHGSADPEAVRDYVDARGLAQSSHRQYSNIARGFSRWLYDEERRDVEPWHGVRLPRKSKPRPTPFTKAEAESLIERADGVYREWFVLAYFAGLRACEIALVEGRHLIDGPHGPELRVPRAKGGVENSVPAHPRVVELFAGKPRGRWYVASADAVAARARIRLRELGVDAGGIHRFRHTFGNELYVGTSDIRTVQGMMRHASIESTLCYVGLDDRKQRAALAAL